MHIAGVLVDGLFRFVSFIQQHLTESNTKTKYKVGDIPDYQHRKNSFTPFSLCLSQRIEPISLKLLGFCFFSQLHSDNTLTSLTGDALTSLSIRCPRLG